MSTYLIAGGIIVLMFLAGKYFKSIRRSASDTVLVHFDFQAAKAQENGGK